MNVLTFDIWLLSVNLAKFKWSRLWYLRVLRVFGIPWNTIYCCYKNIDEDIYCWDMITFNGRESSVFNTSIQNYVPFSSLLSVNEASLLMWSSNTVYLSMIMYEKCFIFESKFGIHPRICTKRSYEIVTFEKHQLDGWSTDIVQPIRSCILRHMPIRSNKNFFLTHIDS